MTTDLVQVSLYLFMLFSLFLFDYALGNGFVGTMQRLLCKIICFTSSIIQQEDKHITKGSESPLHVHVVTFLTQALIMLLTISFLRKYKQFRRLSSNNRLEELLRESKESLRITEEFLEKWRMRRVLTETTYLDEEPQSIPTLKLELPILHMAIVDAHGVMNRNLPESGDAADDPIDWNTSDIYSILSIPDLTDKENLEAIITTSKEEMTEKSVPWEHQQRYLWNVVEEDVDDES